METSPDRTKRSGGHARSGPLLRPRDADAAPPLHRAPVATSRQGTRARPGRSGRVPLVAGAVGILALAAGGAALLLDGDDRPTTATAAGPRASAAATASPAPTPPAGAAPSDAVVAATAEERTPADARAALEEQLAARAASNLSLLRSTWEGDVATAGRAARAVSTSTSGLSAVVAAWGGPALATRLSTGLDEQSNASRAYAAAVAEGDDPAADRARGQMGEVSRRLGALLSSVTDGRIAEYVPPQDAAQLRAYVDALEAEDAAGADEAAAWLRGRLTREGTALALGLSGGGQS